MNATHPALPSMLWVALVLNGAGPAAAAGSTHREHEAHQHGHGVLEVAVQDDELLIALRIPAVNAVGFEHAPGNAEQHRLVEATIARFRHGERLFVTTAAAGCSLVSADVALAGMRGAYGDEHDHDRHGEHQGEHAKHAEQDDAHARHAGEHDHDGHAERDGEQAADRHSELHAEYHYRCANPAGLEAIEVRVFDALDDVEAIEAHVITEIHQGAVDLTAGKATLNIAR